MAMFYALVTLCLLGSAMAQMSAPGKCPRVKGQSDLDVSKIMGEWYEAEKYFTLFELDARCTKVNLQTRKNGVITADKQYISGLTGEEQSYHMKLPTDSKDASRFTVKFPLTPPGNTSKCRVLGSDYDNYLVVHCCNQYGRMNLQYAWIFTRARNPQKRVIDNANEVIDSNNVERKDLWKTEQKRC